MMHINRFNAEINSNKLQYLSIEPIRMAALKLKILVFLLLLTLATAVGNDTNGTAPPPPDNTTNNTNATSPPPPPPGNTTNGTDNTTGMAGNQTNSTMNNTAPPANQTNPPMNGTAGNDTNSTMNGTGPGNGTAPPMNGTAGNDTNSTMNGTGPGNGTAPPMNGTAGNDTNSTMNGTGPGNGTTPPMNGTGSGNGTAPPMNGTAGNDTNSTMNGTGPGNGTAPPMNGTAGNGTNSTMNGTGPGNGTAPPMNGTAPGNTTNSTMNGTGPNNGTSPPMNGTGPGNTTNSTMNGTGPGNGTTPPMNGTGPGNGTNSSMNGTGPNNITNSSMMVTPNANFAPPPPINSSVLLILNKSGDGMFIGSKRLESLQILLNPGNATANTSTTFIINSFSSNAAASNNSAPFSNNRQFTQPGNWTYVTGTRDTLSCSLVFDYNTGSFGLVQYMASNGNFSMVFRSPGSIFSNTTNVTIQTARNTTVLRENCNTVYQTAPNGQNASLFRLTPNGLVPVNVPAGWSVRSSSEWIQYGVASNILYRFDPQNGTFASIHTFPSSQAYALKNAQGRLLVVAANMSAGNNTTVYYQRKYLFQINASSSSLITQFQYTAMIPVMANMTAPPIYPYLASPMLTKLGVVFNAPNSTTPTIIIKSIDSNTNSVSDLTFQEPRRFLATIDATPIDGPKFFGDYFFVVRNDSANPIANTSFVEEAYQFVGTQINFLRNRILTPNDTTGFLNTYIDSTIPNQLVVLDTYNVADGVAIEQFIYGNIATVNKVVPPTTPPFISLIIASGGVPFTGPVEPTSPLTWIYANPSAGNTNITIIQSNSSFPNNVKINTNLLPGSLSIISMNSNCIVTRNTANNTISIASPPPPTNSSNFTASNTSAPFNIQDITPLLSNITLTNTTKWGLSDKCDRFSVNNMVFFRAPNQSNFQPIANNMSAFNPSAISRNIDAAIVGSSIWLLNANGSGFVSAFDINRTLLPNNNIYRRENRIIITATNVTAAQTFAFAIEDNGMFTNCLDYFFPFYQNAPKIQVSSQLSKVLVMGPFIAPNQTQVQPHIDAFFVAFANRTSLNVSFPLEKVPDPVNSFILLDDQFLYIRSLSTSNVSNSSNSSNSSLPNPQENVFFISRDVTPLLASSVNLTQDQLISWKRTAFSPVDDGKMKIYVETAETVNTTNYAIVTVKQVSGQQASLNSDNTQGVTGVLDTSGKIKLCGTGCSDCSSGTCTGCSQRYVFDSSSSLCYPCGPNCATCSSTNTLLCTSCISHTYLSIVNGSCLPCDRSCGNCDITATNCTSCPPGVTLTSGQCSATCPKNCISCSGNSTGNNTCLTCISGFVVVNGACRGCVASCSNCSATNITQCTSCAPGLTLVNSACVPCPDKCQTCSSGVCATCIPGFTPNANGVCVLACQISCATCADNQPSVCLSCYSGAYLSGSSCVLNTTCNTDLSCTDCGQGLGYILVGSQCVQCTGISNCLQCNTGNTQQCSKCMNGFYITSTYLCQACPSSCITCSSADVCTGCVIGYTLAQNQTEGQCIACQSPCASCLGVSTYCLSCVSGYTKKGWKCQSNKNVGFSMILVGAAPADVLNTIDTLLQLILNACRLNDSSLITFTTITAGSTSVSGTTTSSDPSTTSSTLSSALSGGSLGNYTVGSVSVTANGVDSEQSSKSNAGMIAGIVVGVVVLITGAVIIAYIVYKKKQASQIISEEGQIAIEMENAPAMKNESKLSAENYGLRAESANPQEVNLESNSQNAWQKEIF